MLDQHKLDRKARNRFLQRLSKYQINKMPWIKNNILRPINQNILVKSFDINLAWSIAATCYRTVALNVSRQLLPDLHGLFHRDKGSMSAAPFNNSAFCVSGNFRLLLKKRLPRPGRGANLGSFWFFVRFLTQKQCLLRPGWPFARPPMY